MAVPKRRISRHRRGNKRAHQKLTAAALVRCTNCGATIRPHVVCGSCGYYRGKQVTVGSSI